MIQKNNITDIFTRVNRLLFTPEKEWQYIQKEEVSRYQLFRKFIIYPSIIASLFTFLLRLFSGYPLIAFTWGIINLIACITGSYICFRVTREYLANKIRHAENSSLQLTVYSSVIFIIFHSLSVGFAGNFIGDLTAILSLLSIRTLYHGLKIILNPNERLQKNAVIIIGLLIICTPAIVIRILTIIFRIPAINA